MKKVTQMMKKVLQLIISLGMLIEITV
jgi:hypothetical protein